MRNIIPYLERDLQKKMVFVTGPRQVGKTTVAQQLLKKLGGHYYTWDSAEDRERILTKSFLHDKRVVLDELHKYDRWKNFLKGTYDKFHEQLQIFVTGSARMDVYRRGGDSLFGRYFLFHLHPLTLGELMYPHDINRPEHILTASHQDDSATHEAFAQLTKFGGFPEPFFSASEEVHARWSIQRRELLVREDVRDLTNISLLSLVEHLLLLLPSRVGSPLSINALKEDLQVAYNTVRQWLDVFENLYITFTLKPYTTKISRSIHKEKKMYLWDWSQIKDDGARFENLTASHLFKAVTLWRDLGYGDFDLTFIRDRDRREVDFCITKDQKPWLLIEAKLSEIRPDETLASFADRFDVPALQVVSRHGVSKQTGRVRVVSASSFFTLLP
ncbi:MAG: ATP-binding protein [Deltaproteobacteria bacterium]|nr:ATP-binding protein [Deltaproteobacteria bacterium]